PDVASLYPGYGPCFHVWVACAPSETTRTPAPQRSTSRELAQSRPEPIRQLHEAADRDIDRRRRPRLAPAGAFFVRSRDMGGPQPAGGGVREIVGVRCHHHAGIRGKIESLGRRKIDPRLGLVVAGNLGAEDSIPRKAIAAGK